VDIYDERVNFTVLLYLNDNYEKGETYIMDNDNKMIIQKKVGKVIIFQGFKIHHGAETVSNGKKHILIMKLSCAQ